MKVVKCIKDGWIQLTNAIYEFKCNKCEKMISIKKAKVLFWGTRVQCSAFMNRRKHEAEFVNYRKVDKL